MLVKGRQASKERMLRGAIQASIQAHQQLLESLPQLISVSDALIEALSSGGKVLLCGNGGSAADAQHVAAELVGRFARERRPYAAIALTTDSSILTAIANDYDFEQVFARQVRALARPADVVVGISTSGDSANVLAALLAAREMGASSVAVTGASGGRLVRHADVCFCAPSVDTARIQELHLLAWHCIAELVEATLVANSDERGDVVHFRGTGT